MSIGTITHTENITDLSAALAKAQGAIKGAVKDSENPHFRSKYADLASVWEACRKPLSDNLLSVLQSPRLVSAGDGVWLVEVETKLLHATGQWITDTLAVPVSKVDAQGVGSAITYARRYALSAFVGVAPEDDDANAAVGTQTAGFSAPQPPAGARDVSDGPVRIVSAGTRITNTGKKQWTVEFSDGVKATTIHERTGKLCEELNREQCGVIYTTKKNGNFVNLDTVKRADLPLPMSDDGPALTDADIPF